MSEQAPRADLLDLTNIEYRPVDWLWQHRLAAGSVAVISGNPGAGKTWVALAIAAALSKGHDPGTTMPSEDATTPPSTTLYASPHSLGSALIGPRFLSLAGDPSRLILLRGISDAPAPAALSIRDLPILEDALQRTGARLLVLDPLHSYLAPGGRHRAHEAARVFDNLTRLAESHRCCILLVRHLRRRGRSSAAIELSGAARSEFLVGSSPDAPAESALVQTKSNLGPMAPSLGYRIDPAALSSAFHWTGPSTLTAEDLQAEQPIGAGLPRRKRAAQWLRSQLSNGPVTQQAIERAAHLDGASLITIRRAKGDIGVLSVKSTYNGAWYWELPQAHPSTPPSSSKLRSGAGNNEK